MGYRKYCFFYKLCTEFCTWVKETLMEPIFSVRHYHLAATLVRN
jgi:hypothetical protein